MKYHTCKQLTPVKRFSLELAGYFPQHPGYAPQTMAAAATTSGGVDGGGALLPPGWEMKMPDGRMPYIDHNTKASFALALLLVSMNGV